MPDTPTRPTVVVIGGGYGGIMTAKALDDVADVVLVEPKEAFQHNVAALRAVVDPDFAPTTFLPYDRLLTRGRVVRHRATRVDPGAVTLDSGEVLAADVVVLATGSQYPFPAKSDHLEVAEALKAYRVAHEALAAADRVLLLGAGPVGIELAGEIAAVWPDKHVTLLDAGGELDPAGQATLHHNALRTLTRVHATDVDAIGLSHLRTHAEAGVDGQLALWSDAFEWAAEGESNPTVEAALEWTRNHRPAEPGDPVGDARIGNLLLTTAWPSPGCWTGRWSATVPASWTWAGGCSCCATTRRASGRRSFPDGARLVEQYQELAGVRPALLPGARRAAAVDPDAPGRQPDDRRRAAPGRRPDAAEQPGQPPAGPAARPARPFRGAPELRRQPVMAERYGYDDGNPRLGAASVGGAIGAAPAEGITER